MGPTSFATPSRLPTYFKDAHATVDRRAGVLVGVYLPTETKEFYGASYAAALEAAAGYVETNHPGFHI